MHSNQSSYERWTWIIALILALTLSWMLLAGRGPSQCCGAESLTAEPTPVQEAPFTFEASSSTFTNQGDGATIPWFSQADRLKTLLADGSDWQLKGDAHTVTLTGTVESDAIKQQTTAELKAFLGQEVIVDNQLQFPVATPVAEVPAPVKLFFETGKSTLPASSDAALEPTIEWLIAHPNSKAVISGYHDARGNRESNQKLAKARAQASMDALLAAGVEPTRIEMRKPVETEGSENQEEARRVEISIE